MSFTLHHAVIHSFTKEANSSVVTEIIKKTTLLSCNLPAVVSLVKGVSDLLGKPGNSVSWGQFGGDMRQGPFPTAFSNYAQEIISDDIFLTLSYTAVDELSHSAQTESLATGGFILVASYTNIGIPFLLVAMIKQRGGVTLTAEYVPMEIEEIDLSKVHQAMRVNLDRYIAATTIDDDVPDGETDGALTEGPEDTTYLCFVGQNKNNQASNYFIKALGCATGIASARATDNAIKAIYSYFSTEEIQQYRRQARDSLIQYLQDRIDTNQVATIDDISRITAACIPVNLGDKTDELKSFLNNEQNKVPSQFNVDSKTVKNRSKIKMDGGTWSMQFEQNILGTNSESLIWYNSVLGTLTIKDLSQESIRKIKSALDVR